ncbi:transcription activator, effector binding protein [Nitrobacter hamburgensis X14]|uniref:Transcription activator, effector binding protein n=1 Tax=Nitrobacter hamburgensis (strain DSM 10229 / NCIMB 13809 / X14) TaxID=323097 RepID=Q1QHJ2_NITHX|nr:transcription activator, effector binding protein [Nitrobacter hamburgensis X14]
MNCPRLFRRLAIAMIPAALSLGLSTVLAQTPPAAPPGATAPATPAPPAAPTAPGTTTPATPTPPPAEVQTPENPTAEAPKPPVTAPVQTADPFGEEFTLVPKTVLTFRNNATWDTAFETLIDSFKSLAAVLDKQGVKAAGNMMIVYTSTDDTGFSFLAEVPVDQDLNYLPKAMSMGKSPEGKALKFVHRGSYDNMDNTYEAITNHLDDKKLEAKDTFIEEYMTDPLKTEEDNLVINVYVPLK